MSSDVRVKYSRSFFPRWLKRALIANVDLQALQIGTLTAEKMSLENILAGHDADRETSSKSQIMVMSSRGTICNRSEWPVKFSSLLQHVVLAKHYSFVHWIFTETTVAPDG